jgi:hypothetical protein
MKCKKCQKELLQYADNKIKIRTNIIIFEKGEKGETDDISSAIIKCQYCKSDNQIPIALNLKDNELKHFIFEK